MQAYQQSSAVQANKCLGFMHPPKMVLETDSVATAYRKERAETLPSQGLKVAHAAEADSNCFQQPFNNSKQQQLQYPCQTLEQQHLDQKMIPSQIHFNNQRFQQTNPNFQSASSPQSLVTRASESLEKILNQQRVYLEKQIQPRNNNENHERAIVGKQQQQQQYPQIPFQQQQQQFKSGSSRPPQLGEQYSEQNMNQNHNKNDRSQDFNISSKQHNYHGIQPESRQNQQQVERPENDQSQKFQKQQSQLQQQQPMQYLSQVEQNYQQYQEERIRQKEQQNEESQNIEENNNVSNCESENQQVESFKIEIEKRFAKSEVNKIYEFPLDSFNSSVNESDSSLVSLCDARNYDLNIQNIASNRLQSQQMQQGQFKKKQQQQQQLQHQKLEDYEHEKISQPIQVCLSERPINQQDQSHQQKQPISLNTKNIQNFSKNQPTNIKDNCQIVNKIDSPMDKHSNNHFSGKTLQRTLQTKSIQNLHGLSHSPPQTKQLSTIEETECADNLMKSNHAMMSHNLNTSCNANGLGQNLQSKLKNQPNLQFQQQQQQPSQILPKDIEMFQGDNSQSSQAEGISNKRLKQQLDTILKNNFIEPTDSPSNQQIQAKQQHDLNWKLLQEKSESCYRNVNNLIEKIQSEREKKQQHQQQQEDVEEQAQGISEKELIRREVSSQEKEKISISEKQQVQNPQQFQQSSTSSSVLQKMRAKISTDVKSAQIVHSPNTQSTKSQFQQLQATKKERYETSRSFEVRKHGNQHNNASNESNNNSKSNQNISRNYLPSPSYSQTYLSKQIHAQQVQQVASQKSNIRPNTNQQKIQIIERTSSSKAFQDRNTIITNSKSQSRERTSGNQSTSNNRTYPLSTAAGASEKSSIISNDLKRNHSNTNNESNPPSRSASQKAAGVQEQQLPSTAQSQLSNRLIKNQNSQSHKSITSSQIVHSKNQSNTKHTTFMKNAIIPETESFVSEKLPQQTAATDPARFVLPDHTQPTIFSPLPPSGKADQSPSTASNSLEGNSILTKNMLALSQRVQAAIQGQLSSSSVSKEGNGLCESNKPKNASSKKTSSANLMKTQSNSNLIINTTSTSSRVHANNSGGGNHSFNNTSKTNIRDIRLKLSSDAMSSPNNQTNSTNSFSQFKETPVIGDIKSNQSRRTDSSHRKTAAQYQQLQTDSSFPSNNSNNGNAISSPNQKNNNNNQSYTQNKGNSQVSSQDHAVKPASQSTKALNSSSRERDNCGRMQQTTLGYVSSSDSTNPNKTNHVNVMQQPQQDQQIPNQIKMKNNNKIILKNLLQQHQQQPGGVQPGNIKNNNSESLKKSQQQLNLDHSKLQNAPANQSQIRTSQSNYANKTLIKVPSASTVGNALKRASPNKSTNQAHGAATTTHDNLHQIAQENSLNARNNNNNSHSRTQHSQSPPHNFPNSIQVHRNQTINCDNNSNNANNSSNMHHGKQKTHEQQQQQQPSQRSSQHASQPSTSASSKASLLHSIMQKTAKANKQIIGQQNYIDSQQNDQTNNSSLALYKKSLEATLVNQISQQSEAQTQQLKQQQQILYQQNHPHNLPRNNNNTSSSGSSAMLNTQPSPTRNVGIQNAFNAAKKPQSNAPIAYLLGPVSNINANGRNTGSSKNLNNSCNTNQRASGLSSSKPINSNISISRNAQQNLSSAQNIDQSSSSILHSFIDQPANDARLLSHLIPATNNINNKEPNREYNSGISGIPRNDISRGMPKNFSQKSFGGEKASSNSTNAYPQVQQLLQSMDFVSRKGNNEGSSSSGILGQTSSFSSRYQPAAQNNLNQDKLEQNNELQNRLKPQHMFEQQMPQYRPRTLQDS